MRNYFNLLLAGFIVLGATSCDKHDDHDDHAPEIELKEPERWEKFASGDKIHFEALIKDESGISEYEIDIHNDFDSHAHGRLKSPSLPYFYFDEHFDGEGKKKLDIHKDIEIKMGETTKFAAGPYHFIVNAINMKEIKTSYADGTTKEVEVYITNDEMPVLEGFEENITNGKVRINKGETLTFKGIVKDVEEIGKNPGLHEIEIIISEFPEEGHTHDHGGHSHRVAASLPVKEEVKLEGAMEYDLANFPGLKIPSTTKHGDYDLKIAMIDEDGNIAVEHFVLHVD
jgi:hypothetical protein